MTTGIDKMEERKIERYCKERASERTSNRRKKKTKKVSQSWYIHTQKTWQWPPPTRHREGQSVFHLPRKFSNIFRPRVNQGPRPGVRRMQKTRVASANSFLIFLSLLPPMLTLLLSRWSMYARKKKTKKDLCIMGKLVSEKFNFVI